MSGEPKILAVIPARGGSKGVPRKNIRDVAGKPLIAYAIEAALGADHLYKVIVSTDDEEIAQIAKDCGADVPFMRPAELATDEAASLPVVQHAVQQIEAQDGVTIDWTILIQPTNPFVTAEDINGGVALAKSGNGTSVVSVVKAMDSHPLKIKVIKGRLLKPYIEDAPETVRRQDLKPEVYKRNGSFYMTCRDVLMERSSMYGDRILPYEMPPERSHDIDTELDLKLAEFLLKGA